MALYRPLGTIIPDAVFEDIGLFFNEEQLNEFRSLSPRANRLFKKYRMMAYTTASIHKLNNGSLKISWGCDFNKILFGIAFPTNEVVISNDPDKKLLQFLEVCNSVDTFTIFALDITEGLMKSLIGIKTKKLLIAGSSISVSLSLFWTFLLRHPNVVNFRKVRLPSELVSNKTLKLMSEIDLVRLYDANNSSFAKEVADVTDDFPREIYTSSFKLYGFKTKFTMEGISQFLEKIDNRDSISFGILSSDQLQEAIDYERSHHKEQNKIRLLSWNGLKTLAFHIDIMPQGRGNEDGDEEFWENDTVTASYYVNLNPKKDSIAVHIPHDVVSQASQISFEFFNKVINSPAEHFLVNELQVDALSFNHNIYAGTFNMTYCMINYAIIERTNTTLNDVHKFIIAILQNCSRIDCIVFDDISLDEDFYELLKPIAANIAVDRMWNIDICVKPESLRAILETEGGLLGTIDFTKSEYKSEELLPTEVFVLYIGRKFLIDVAGLTPESTSLGSDTCLTDGLLYLLSLKGLDLPDQFSFESHKTTFTAKGIKEFIESAKAVRNRRDDDPHYVLGTIDETKAEEVVLLVQECEKDEKNWIVTNKNITRNGQTYCTVIIHAKTKWYFEYGCLMVAVKFDIPKRADD